MKRIITVLLAVLMVGAFLCACGKDKKENVTTKVSAKYDDGYASKYADSSSTDKDGNVTYQFSGDQYDKYRESHKNSLGVDIQKDIAQQHKGTDDEVVKYGEYAYINEDKQAVIVGVHDYEYDKATAEKESAIAAEYGFKYFQNLKDPVDTIKVIYCNCNDQNDVYDTFEYSAD